MRRRGAIQEHADATAIRTPGHGPVEARPFKVREAGEHQSSRHPCNPTNRCPPSLEEDNIASPYSLEWRSRRP